jgi:hypothetical protein
MQGVNSVLLFLFFPSKALQHDNVWTARTGLDWSCPDATVHWGVRGVDLPVVLRLPDLPLRLLVVSGPPDLPLRPF